MQTGMFILRVHVQSLSNQFCPFFVLSLIVSLSILFLHEFFICSKLQKSSYKLIVKVQVVATDVVENH